MLTNYNEKKENSAVFKLCPMGELRIITALLVVVLVCCVREIKGRPNHYGHSHNSNVSAKKHKYLEWIQWFASPHDEELSRLVINDTISQYSPVYKCIQACFGIPNSVSVIHNCNRDCVLNPHKFDNFTATPDQSRVFSTDKDVDESKREYSKENTMTRMVRYIRQVVQHFSTSRLKD